MECFCTKGLSMNNVCILARAPGPLGLLPASPLAVLLAPYILPGMLVARALPEGLAAAAKCKRYSLTSPNVGGCRQDRKFRSWVLKPKEVKWLKS